MSENSLHWKYNSELEILHIYHVWTQEELDHVLNLYKDKNINYLSVNGDWAEKLEVPPGVETVLCSRLALKSLVLPESVEVLYADYNKLKHIQLPSGIKKAILNNNLLESITFTDTPYQIESLDVAENRLKNLDFPVPDTFWELIIAKNMGLKITNPDMQKVLDAYEPDYV